ncbi:hypothetical protein [Arthrobacter sp. UYEF36]|uniref:hypothetical protein n=1 Tax=Arthrobacter sp. UYEF36 TaxID=1756366 RepID=UPI0033917167
MKTGPVKLAVALLLAGATTGCSGSVPNACPAIAWFNSLTVSLDGAVGQVSLVEFCAESVCSVRADGPVRDPATSVSPGAVPAPATTLAVTAAPAPPGRPYSPFTVARVDDRTWQVSLMMQSPTTATIRAYSADGNVLARREVELRWTRVGGSEACGGPETAGPVRLVL